MDDKTTPTMSQTPVTPVAEPTPAPTPPVTQVTPAAPQVVTDGGSKGGSVFLLVGIILVVLLLVGGVYWYLQNGQSSTDLSMTPTETVPSAEDKSLSELQSELDAILITEVEA